MKKPDHHKDTIVRPTYARDKAPTKRKKNSESNAFPKNDNLKGKW